MTRINLVKAPLMAAFPDAPQGGRVFGASASIPWQAAPADCRARLRRVECRRAPIGAATGDGITDSQAEAVKRLVPFQSYVGMRQALDLLTADE